jgi:hypothetical protein
MLLGLTTTKEICLQGKDHERDTFFSREKTFTLLPVKIFSGNSSGSKEKIFEPLLSEK